MGLTKHFIPKKTRRHMVDWVNEKLPSGFFRENLANAETIGGLGMVALGSKVDGKAGLFLRAVGELADDWDGDTARALDIASVLGAYADTVADKIKMLIEIKTLWKHANNFETKERRKRHFALGFIATKHVVNAILNTTSQALHLNPHSSTSGKANMWFDGGAVIAFGLSDVIEDPQISKRIADFGYMAVAAGVTTGVASATGYAKHLINGINSRSD